VNGSAKPSPGTLHKAVIIMNEDDRIHFELRNELALTVEVDRRTSLDHHLALAQKAISKLAREACLKANRGDQNE
jgi:antitoxin component of MazEF toxin-antitoxin module